MCFTTDNVSDVVLRERMKMERLVLLRSHLYVRCIAHIIHLALKASSRDMHLELKKYRSLVGAVKSSIKRRDTLDRQKRLLTLKDVRMLDLDVDTRWSSTLEMTQNAHDV